MTRLSPKITTMSYTMTDPNTTLIGKPDCRYCDGTGIRYTPNGPEDFEKEVCFCTDEAITTHASV